MDRDLRAFRHERAARLRGERLDELRSVDGSGIDLELWEAWEPELRPELVVRSHHERLDGSGYPDGLAGDRIPLAARWFAIIDSFVRS